MSIFQIIRFILLAPIIWLITIINRKKTEEEIYFIFQKWGKRVLSFIGYRLEATGQENVPTEGPVFFVSNHQGTLDPLLVVNSCPLPMAFISKKENEKMPLFGRCACLIGTIHFDRETREGNVFMLRESARRMKAGKSLLIFPEGTRSKGDKMNEFKAGALQPAYLAKATIVPVTLNNAYCIDDKKDKNREVKITYGKAIPYEEYKQYKHEEMGEILFGKIESKIEYEKKPS